MLLPPLNLLACNRLLRLAITVRGRLCWRSKSLKEMCIQSRKKACILTVIGRDWFCGDIRICKSHGVIDRVSQFRFKKIHFEAKLSETETVLLCFASVSQNHKKISLHFASFRFVSFALFRFSFAKPRKSFSSFRVVSLRKLRFVSLKKRFVTEVLL